MKLSGVARLIIPLLWSFFTVTSAFSKLGGNDTDKISLLEFKANVIDPLGALNTWNETVHFCKWPGIMCGRRHQRVTSLFIYSSQLGGHLSPYIGNLSFLKRLDLENNSFGHQIPEEIGRLFRLQILRLHNNSFSGAIPSNLSRCSSLQELVLDNNKLVGEIPPEIGLLPNLKLLSLGSNDLQGEIPSSIANLSNTLEIFAVESNSLGGRIPSSFALLKRMKFLSLGGNYLSGTIPPSIYNLSSIQVFSVQTNRLHGEIPSRLGHTLLPKLEAFFFHTNHFSGAVPDISNASNLMNFQISINHLTGKVPKFSNLPVLNILGIDENNLGSGEDGDLDFLASLVNCTNLEVLDVNKNNFGGEIPECISNLSTKLWLMPFGGNQIRGIIPIEIGNLVGLQALGFEDNRMSGPIPSSIGKLQKLYGLSLDNNKFSGTIPSSFGNLTSLNILSIMSNNLQGGLPSSLGKCKNMAALVVSGNNLSGSIPKEVIGLSSLSQDLDLSRNHFTGSIPNEVSQLINLDRLDLSDNKLSGEIPRSLGDCTVLEYLFLGGNALQGTIPKSFGTLKGLIVIDFSRNNLSGKFPTYLENFRFLRKVDISFNDLEGEMPTKGIFANASAISVVGNSRLCGGIAQLDLPRCPSKLNNKHKQSATFIASVVCGPVAILILALVSWILLRKRKKRGKSIFGSLLGVPFLEVSYGDLLKATDGFCAANLIGSGSFGSVYKANIPTQNDPLTVAIKILNLQASRALKSFVAECRVLGSIKHRNVVKLLTACSSIDFQGNDFKALVYEFVINGNLEEWLHPRREHSSEQGRHLNFMQRINISVDVANAIDYLHNNSHVSIVHSDLKPSNILLDIDMIARVGDFGLARFLDDPSRLFSLDQSSSLGIRGSIGYIAPEYSMGGEPSKAGDVYSYGILLLEMFTGKRPTDEMFKDSFNLHNFVKRSLPGRLSQIVDSTLLVRVDRVEERNKHNNVDVLEIDHAEGNGMTDSFWNCLNSVLKIGASCSESAPKERMSIGDVIKELQHIKITYAE